MKATSPYLNRFPRTREDVLAGRKPRYLTEAETDAFMDRVWIEPKPVAAEAPLWFWILLGGIMIAIPSFLGGMFLWGIP